MVRFPHSSLFASTAVFSAVAGQLDTDPMGGRPTIRDSGCEHVRKNTHTRRRWRPWSGHSIASAKSAASAGFYVRTVGRCECSREKSEPGVALPMGTTIRAYDAHGIGRFLNRFVLTRNAASPNRFAMTYPCPSGGVEPLITQGLIGRGRETHQWQSSLEAALTSSE